MTGGFLCVGEPVVFMGSLLGLESRKSSVKTPSPTTVSFSRTIQKGNFSRLSYCRLQRRTAGARNPSTSPAQHHCSSRSLDDRFLYEKWRTGETEQFMLLKLNSVSERKYGTV